MDLFPVPAGRNAEAAAFLALVGASEKQEHLPEHRFRRGTNAGEVRAPWSCPLRISLYRFCTDFPVRNPIRISPYRVCTTKHQFPSIPGFWLHRGLADHAGGSEPTAKPPAMLTERGRSPSWQQVPVWVFNALIGLAGAHGRLKPKGRPAGKLKNQTKWGCESLPACLASEGGASQRTDTAVLVQAATEPSIKGLGNVPARLGKSFQVTPGSSKPRARLALGREKR